MGLKLVTPPAVEPITLAELKIQCSLTDSSLDALLTNCIKAARAKAENYTGAAIVTQTWDQTLDAWPDDAIEILKPPATAITSITYRDAAGTTQTLSSALYSLDTATFPGWVLPKFGTSWPATDGSANAITLRYVTGYADASAVPGDMRLWLLMTAAYFVAQREAIVINERGQTSTPIPAGFMDTLLDFYRVFKV
jgi:uncharacterized phiE125 gp8 family phage protein